MQVVGGEAGGGRTVRDARQPATPHKAVAALMGRGGAYTSGRVLQVLVQVLALPAITRLVEPEEYGVVAAGLVVCLLFGAVAASGLPAAVTRAFFLPVDGEQRARSLVGLAAVTSLATAAVAHATGRLWAGLFDGVDYGPALLVATWTVVPTATRNAAQGHLQAAGRVAGFLISGPVCNAGGQLLGVALLIVWEPTAVAYLTGIGVGAVAGAGVALGAMGRPLVGLPNRGAIGWALAFSAPVALFQLGGALLKVGDRIVVERVLGLGAMGAYHVAYTVGSLGLVLATAVRTAWGPLFYATAVEERQGALEDARQAIMRIGALLVVGLALISPLALGILVGPRYRPEQIAPVAAIVAFAAMPALAQSTSSHVIMEAGRTATLGWATILAALANLLLNLMLVPPCGIQGAAGATVAAYLLQAALLSRAARSTTGGTGCKRADAAPWVFAVAGVAAAVVAPTSGGWTWARLVASAALAGLGVKGVVKPLGGPQQPERGVPTAASPSHGPEERS